ncbi:hypothetical protein JCM10207_003861 [Rhodosporidiobolus poonsookiae]
MPLWSRAAPASTNSPSSTTSPLPSSSASSPPVPPSFLANHHRRSSSNLSQANKSASNKGKHAQRRQESVVELDDEPWDEGSDDDEQVARLATNLSSVTLTGTGKPHVPAISTADASQRAGTPTPSGAHLSLSPSSAGPAPSSASSSSWFNPFASASSRTPGTASRQASASSLSVATLTTGSSTPGASPSLAAEAVAAALAGKPVQPQRGASYLAGASKVQEEADRAVRAEERRKSLERGEEPAPEPTPEAEAEVGEVGEGAGDGAEGEDARGEEAPKMERRGSGWQKEQWKKAIRPDLEELVKDPTHVLPRLRTAWSPAPPARTARASISSVSGLSPNPDADASFASLHPPGSADEEDDDLPSGYVQLDAPSLSSADPTLFDYSAPPPNPEEEGERGRENRRKRKFLDVLEADSVDLAELRKLAWNGVPSELRTMVWQVLLGYLPLPASRRASTLARKRSEYAALVSQAFSRGVRGLDARIWHQISIDVPRTRPGVLLWAAEATQRSLERVLYVWAIRHPASGYVQGINDLVCPFIEVFLESYITSDPETFDVSVLPPLALEALEADSFWCLSKLLDGIQENYINAQPGILRGVKKMEGLCKRVDAPLAAHLSEQGVEFIQFAFRWMNCLLMRELSVKNIVRMWDTYLAEGGDAFSEFHLYVCLAFLVRWSDKLREMDFQSIIIFLQSLPTQNWQDKDTELLLSEAFLWSRTFQAR